MRIPRKKKKAYKKSGLWEVLPIIEYRLQIAFESHLNKEFWKLLMLGDPIGELKSLSENVHKS